MFPNSPARPTPIYGIIWLLSLVHIVATATLSLDSELALFIPSCAAQCFLSFINVNYGLTKCGNTPSRKCLCEHGGASGFTIGEGALQCITTERAIGFCSFNEASSRSLQSLRPQGF